MKEIINRIVGRPSPAARAAVERLWGAEARAKGANDDWKLLSWDAHPVMLAQINRRISGDPDEHWLTFLKRRYAPDGVESGLSLGCGAGGLERHAVHAGLCRLMDGCDLSSDALAVAAELARKEGLTQQIRYFQFDLNADRLPRDRYDMCFSCSAIHHVDNLEHALGEIASALHADGLFILLEYVGPTRFQWSDRVQALMARVLDILPESHRALIRNRELVKRSIERPAVEVVAAADPSEAVRSGEILSLMDVYFDVLYRADLGGTLLQYLLADIAGNFRAEDPRDRALLELLALFEETLITERVIPSDFVLAVARPRSRA
jgi:SAM-dependent methyltransferase